MVLSIQLVIYPESESCLHDPVRSHRCHRQRKYNRNMFLFVAALCVPRVQSQIPVNQKQEKVMLQLNLCNKDVSIILIYVPRVQSLVAVWLYI
jgi:hypothetical protein